MGRCSGISDVRKKRRSRVCTSRLTTVCVDVVRLQEANFEIMKDCRFVQVAESREVIFPHQDVRVT